MSEFANGFRAGMNEAARTLWEAADTHLRDSAASKKVLESEAHKLASALLASWANGLAMNAERSIPETGEKS